MKTEEILICQCHSTDHQIVFLYDDEDNDRIVYMHTHLSKKSFWERIKHGIKYIFGYQSKYGAFDEFIIKPEDAYKFKKVYEYLNKCEYHIEREANCEDDECIMKDNLEID